MAQTSPRNVGGLVVLNHERAQLSSLKTTASSSSLTKSQMKLTGIYLFLLLR